MTIEEALRQIADTDVVGSDESGWTYCPFCDAEGGWNASKFIHVDCPWEYLKKTVEEDDRIEKALEVAFPGLFTHTK